MASETITVVGLTGNQGLSVANHFLNANGWEIRGITRDPTSAKAQAWGAKGTEIVQVDISDVESLESSGDEASFKAAKDLGKTIEAYAGDLEAGQAINAPKAASHPEVLSTLERFVFSTLPAAAEISGGKYTHTQEIDSKANAEKFLRQYLKLSTPRWCQKRSGLRSLS